MKTFKELTTNDTLNPMFHQYGPTLLGPGMGQYQPVADLNAQRQMLGPNIPQGNFKEIKKSDLDQIEKYADRLFGALDIDVEFTRHFLDRVNDKRNKRPIVPAELTRLFKQTYKKFGKTIRKLGPDAEAVINDMKTDINMPFVLNLKGGELELVAKTVMRKKNFQTSNPKLSFEELVKEEFKFFPKKLHKRITLPSPPMDLQREADIVKQIMSKRTAKDEESIRNHDENSFYAIEMYCKENGLIFHDNEMKDIVIGARPTIKYFKKLFNLTRPFEFDKSIKPMSSVTNKTRSYPSGHATQSRLVGLYVANKFPEHEKNIMEAAKECAMGRVQAGFHYLADYVAGNLLADKMFLVMNKDDYGKYLDEGIGEPNLFAQKTHFVYQKNVPDYQTIVHRGTEASSKKYIKDKAKFFLHKGRDFVIYKKPKGRGIRPSDALDFKFIADEKNPRIPRKKGQHKGSSSHSDLYTDENPRGTIHGLGFKDVETARASVKKIENSGKKHAHKVQAAVAMEQRAKEMGKRAEAAIYRAYIEKMKKKTKEMQKEDMHGFKCPAGYKFDKKLMACVPTKSRFKTQYAYPYFGGGDKSGDQSGETQNGQNGNGNGNGANGNGANGNGGNGNGNGGGESFLAADVRKMPDGRFGVYADVFKKGRRVMTPGGKHRKELKKVYKREKDANDYMAAIMIAKGGG